MTTYKQQDEDAIFSSKNPFGEKLSDEETEQIILDIMESTRKEGSINKYESAKKIIETFNMFKND